MNGNVLDTLHPSLATVGALVMNGAGIIDFSGIQSFTNLSTLYCQVNPIVSGAEHPPLSLTALYIRNCGPDTLPSSPNTWFLQCQGNNLTSLPLLPNTLEELWCDISPLPALPTLPSSLCTFYCEGIGLTSLPSLSAWTGDPGLQFGSAHELAHATSGAGETVLRRQPARCSAHAALKITSKNLATAAMKACKTCSPSNSVLPPTFGGHADIPHDPTICSLELLAPYSPPCHPLPLLHR